jgi:alcohol dehydrogenase (NADP+)
MQDLVRPNGPVRFIGVSNFSPEQMEDIIKLPGIKPKVHQFESHPYLQQSKFVQWHIDHGIGITAYAPLANTSPSYRENYNKTTIPYIILENPVLREIKDARGCDSEAQVALAWNVKRGVAVIPKASKPEHQDENLEVETCASKLTDEDMTKIEKFTSEKKWVGRMNNPCKQYRMPCFKGLEEANGGEWRQGKNVR